MDAVILVLIIIILVLLFKRTFSSFVYAVVIVDIFLRIVTYIKLAVCTGWLYNVLNKYIPISLIGLINKYSDGLISNLLVWGMVVIYILFEFYIIKTFLRKR